MGELVPPRVTSCAGCPGRTARLSRPPKRVGDDSGQGFQNPALTPSHSCFGPTALPVLVAADVGWERGLGQAGSQSVGGRLVPGVCFTRRCHNPLTVCSKAWSLYS